MHGLVKAALWVSSLGLVSIAALIGYLAWEDNRRSEERAKVTMAAVFDPEGCGLEGPLRVTLTNASARTVENASFSLEIYERGRSENLARYGQSMTFYTITPARSSKAECWPLPLPKAETYRGDLAVLRYVASKYGEQFAP